jgi:hypothetical protein
LSIFTGGFSCGLTEESNGSLVEKLEANILLHAVLLHTPLQV